VRNILPRHTIPTDILNRAEARIKECFEIATKKLSSKISPPVFEGVEFFSGSQTAGYVIPSRTNKVFLNLELFTKNESHFKSQTIPHEVAHIFADYLNDSRGVVETAHGQTWKRIMQQIFQLTPIRCHSYDTTGIGRTRKLFRYICSCRKIDVGAHRHKKMSLGAKYHCTKCKKTLVFLSEL